jgi:hypothetical protein
MTTAMTATQQTMTLQEFLHKYPIDLPRLSEEQQEELSQPFTMDEIKEAMQDACEDSAPGPSGQTIAF